MYFEYYDTTTNTTIRPFYSQINRTTNASTFTNFTGNKIGFYNDALQKQLIDYGNGNWQFYDNTGGATFTVSQQHLLVGYSAPTLNSCGSSPSISGSDQAGLVTIGSGGTGCGVAFAVQYYPNVPYCVVTDQTLRTTMAYTISLYQITISGVTAGDKINYVCMGQNGG